MLFFSTKSRAVCSSFGWTNARIARSTGLRFAYGGAA
jgi:hypothetical protein